MALRAGYYGLKKKLIEKVTGLPAIKSIGSGLLLNTSTGELSATGLDVSVVANPEGTAAEDLTKLKVDNEIYGVKGDTSACYKTTDDIESDIVDADYIPFFDSSAALGEGATKKSTWSNFVSKIQAKLMETVKTEITFESTYESNVALNKLYKNGKVVTLNFKLSGVSSITGFTKVAEIPVDYRPSFDVWGSLANVGGCYVTSTGVLAFGLNTTSSDIIGTVTWIID